VDNIKPNTVPKKQKASPINPFIKMIEDKKNIARAIEEGKPLSTIKDIKFVKPSMI
jgi:hypothetical protein